MVRQFQAPCHRQAVDAAIHCQSLCIPAGYESVVIVWAARNITGAREFDARVGGLVHSFLCMQRLHNDGALPTSCPHPPGHLPPALTCDDDDSASPIPRPRPHPPHPASLTCDDEDRRCRPLSHPDDNDNAPPSPSPSSSPPLSSR